MDKKQNKKKRMKKRKIEKCTLSRILTQKMVLIAALVLGAVAVIMLLAPAFTKQTGQFAVVMFGVQGVGLALFGIIGIWVLLIIAGHLWDCRPVRMDDAKEMALKFIEQLGMFLFTAFLYAGAFALAFYVVLEGMLILFDNASDIREIFIPFIMLLIIGPAAFWWRKRGKVHSRSYDYVAAMIGVTVLVLLSIAGIGIGLENAIKAAADYGAEPIYAMGEVENVHYDFNRYGPSDYEYRIYFDNSAPEEYQDSRVTFTLYRRLRGVDEGDLCIVCFYPNTHVIESIQAW